jgi:hypothetical protein
MLLPETEEDERPFLLSQLQTQIKQAIDSYIANPENKERTEFYKLNKTPEEVA